MRKREAHREVRPPDRCARSARPSIKKGSPGGSPSQRRRNDTGRTQERKAPRPTGRSLRSVPDLAEIDPSCDPANEGAGMG